MNEFFSTAGRLNRRPYFFRTLALSIPSYLLIELPKAWKIEVGLAASLLSSVIVLAALVVLIFQAIKRLHDLDMSGWYAAVTFVPLVNFFFGLYLTFMKGTDGPNRFGEDLLKNTDASPSPAV